MEIDQELRNGVIESLPEAKNIEDDDLRERVYDAWALSLSMSTFKRIEEIRASGGPETPAMLHGTQADHLNGVARIGVAMVRALKRKGMSAPMSKPTNTGGSSRLMALSPTTLA